MPRGSGLVRRGRGAPALRGLRGPVREAQGVFGPGSLLGSIGGVRERAAMASRNQPRHFPQWTAAAPRDWTMKHFAGEGPP